MTTQPPPGGSEGASPRRRFSIAAYLGIGLGGLLATALGLLLWITLSTVFKNTTELLNDKSRIFLGALTSQTRHYLNATLAPTRVAAIEIGSGRIDPGDDEKVMPLMRTLLAATPQVTALAFFDVDGTRVVSYREGVEVFAERQTSPDRDEIRAAMAEAEAKGGVLWGPPIHDPAIGTFVNMRRAVFRDERFLGMMTAVINVQTLSTFLDGLETEIGQNAFILYDRTFVLAHRRLILPFDGLNEDRPLPGVGEIGDQVLAEIWADDWEDNRLVAGSGHFYGGGERDYIFLYESLEDYADAPWLVGSYFPEDTISAQVQRMVASSVLSLLIVLATIVATYLFGRFLRRPVAALAEAADLVGGLDFEKVPAIEPSRFAELDNAGRAFNSMVAALLSFSHYVPKRLVDRLVTAGDESAIRSELKPVTIMMVDITGFTPRAERMGAEETADFLNAHLAMITGCIEAEGGVVDKFMGDGVMAHWGAIDPEPDQASRAATAALELASALHKSNAGREDPVQLRIGIHSGDVVVGNIGTATRMNYTVVGDAVNMAQRLEVLGKTLLPEAEAAILLSAETRHGLDAPASARSLGFHALRGREGQVEVFSLGPKMMETA